MKGCGTLAGIRGHHDRGEKLCGLCATEDRVLQLEAERLRPVPPIPDRTAIRRAYEDRTGRRLVDA